MKKLRHIVLFFIALTFVTHLPAFACSDKEYEQCVTVNLLVGTYKDCKCLPKIGGTVGQVGEAIKPTISNVVSEVRKSPQAIADCIGNVGTCVTQILASPLAIPLQAYMDLLYKQSEGRVIPFSPEFIALAQPYYSVDLRGVTSADGINTGHGATVAYCDRIFFAPARINVWDNYSDLHLALHELEHTVQCQGRGKSAYLAEYVLKGAMDMILSGRVNVHDMHDYEVAAANKADRVAPLIWQRIQSARSGNGGNVQWLNYCQTAAGTCQMYPHTGYMGSPCSCQTPMGAIPGSAY